ncbi:MAG TPA: YbaK/EbsC family protein [Anaerohalosphaeraceae bacterium]|jgi:Ala-tRNA(Pro) deacylase|nr:YbaK/EbsC family protein [Anaerohalosphaeraceae bacterium]HRT50399.1 YbaK/EbsC family protein [Anaerohalosphaeraceae bacterium]HRT86329.1 YbaK/EbsC family protein [Anaerohalosphaeraceae bacterium]
MEVIDVLDREAVHYETSTHRPVYTAQEVAQEEHVSGRNVAKCVVVNADGRDYVCVLPACCKIDLEALRSVLEADHVELVDEARMAELFEDCEVGAEPPFGSFYGLPTIMDDRLEQSDFIVFQGGRHDRAIRMDMPSYLRIERPRIFSFSYHIT